MLIPGNLVVAMKTIGGEVLDIDVFVVLTACWLPSRSIILTCTTVISPRNQRFDGKDDRETMKGQRQKWGSKIGSCAWEGITLTNLSYV